MKKNGIESQTLKNIAFTAVCIALCIILPQAFHLIPNGGKIFSPMHIPILICGLACAWQYGLICALSGVLLSSLLTSMPTVPQLPSMMTECAVYAVSAALLIHFLRKGRRFSGIYISLVGAMIAGRLAGGIVKAFILGNEYNLHLWVSGYFIKAFPAIIIHLLLIPPIVRALAKSGFIKE
ncbi:MAG: ECF transporter S component [Clostridia bacterium]|nr:ECF transporter S component [Clostridia bacterium]